MRHSGRSVLGTLLCATAVSLALPGLVVPGLAAAPQPPVIPGTEAPPKKESRSVPDGVPTTRETVYLPTRDEVHLGRQIAGEVDKEYEVITEGPDYDRLQRISSALVAVVQKDDIVEEYLRRYRLPRGNDRGKRVPFEFSFRLVRPKSGQREVNAFSLAGGPIFVTTDLMQYVSSDHELAGVLAHEIAHVCYHHVVQMVQKQSKSQRDMMWGALGSLLLGLGGAGSEAFGALYGVQLYSVAKLSGYGRDLEREADWVGANLLAHTDYNPVGLLTFMRKLARDEARRGEPDFGIYQSHPYSSERVQLIEAHLRQKKVAVDHAAQRRVQNRFVLETVAQVAEGAPAEVRLNGRLVIRLAETGDFQSAAQRAEWVADRLEELFLERSLTIRNLRLREDGTTIAAFGVPILRVLPGDAALAKRTPPQLAAEALRVMQTELWSEKLDNSF